MDPNLFRGDRRVTQRGTKGRPVHSPIGVEIRYQSEIRKLVAASDADVRAALSEYLDSWVQEYAALTGIRRDSWVDSLTSVFNSIVARMVGRLATEGPAIVRRASLETDDSNRRRWRATVRAAYGVDVFKSEPWLPGRLAAWEAENLGLITRMQTDRIDRIRGLVTRAVGAATRSTEIEAQVQSALGVGRGRAKLIARDQISKLNGNLTHIRQEASGVEEYEWSTSQDERVRPTHRSKQGKRFRWDSPPSDTGHPGADIQCRCVALPILPMVDDILREAGLA